MRLHLDSGIPTQVETGHVAPASSATGGSGVRGTANRGLSDSVAISGLTSVLTDSSAARGERLRQISAAVANGTYAAASPAIGAAIVAQAIV